MFDVLIINGTVIDGTGEAGYQADVGVTGEFIAAIGNLQDTESKRIINASGYVISPGFIDTHTHSDLSLIHISEPTRPY